MMFDPPDFPYKELSDTIRDECNVDVLLVNNATEINCNSYTDNKNLTVTTEEIISSIENHMSLRLTDADLCLDDENSSSLNLEVNNQNAELFIVQTDDFINNDPILLDDNIVNQFLLPLSIHAEENKEKENNESVLLAVHTCTNCHELFPTDADLLAHKIFVHTSNNPTEEEVITNTNDVDNIIVEDNVNNNIDFEAEWLVCSLCERVLSTALEIEPCEPLCCNVGDGKGNVSLRKLDSMYVCDICKGLFANGEALDRHRLTCFVTDQQNYYTKQTEPSVLEECDMQCSEICYSCDICGTQYTSAEELKIHSVLCQQPAIRRRRQYSTNSNNKMWNCGSCNQLFATARELYRHKRGEDRPSGAPLMAYVCEECDKVLGSMCALHTHKKMHKVSKPGYPCRICGRRFNQSGHLAIHMRMHTGERPYPCDLCPKAFKVKVERDDHRRTHTGERPFACSACPKTFTAAARLREHARIHTDQRPYRCDICGAAFRRPYARTVHTLIHTGEKPHECDICGTAFRRSGDMWKHKRTIHGIQAVGDTEPKDA